MWSSQTAYRRRFPIWLDKLVAGSAPCLHSNQWCWASVTAHVLFQNEYVNATGCSFSLGRNLALSPWLRPLCAYFMREMVWGVIWKAAVTCWGMKPERVWQIEKVMSVSVSVTWSSPPHLSVPCTHHHILRTHVIQASRIPLMSSKHSIWSA